MTHPSCPAFNTSDGLQENAQGVANGVKELIQQNVQSRAPKTWRTLLLERGRKATKNTLLCTLVAAGVAPIFLPAIGIGAPTGFLTGALFNWTTGIGTGALGGWLANFSTAHHQADENEAILDSAEKLVDLVAGGDSKILIGVCKIVQQKGLLNEFEEAYRSEFGKSLTADTADMEQLIRDSKDQVGKILNIAEGIESHLEEMKFAQHQINSLENEVNELREFTNSLTPPVTDNSPQSILSIPVLDVDDGSSGRLETSGAIKTGNAPSTPAKTSSNTLDTGDSSPSELPNFFINDAEIEL